MTSEPRLAIAQVSPGAYQAMLAFSGAAEAGLDKRLVALIKVRTSQINGCSFCTDMHSREALEAGEPALRLVQLPVWRETPHFDARERAALALTESMTRIADRVSEEVYAAAAREFEAAELGQLLWTIAEINAWNRIGIATRLGPRPLD